EVVAHPLFIVAYIGKQSRCARGGQPAPNCLVDLLAVDGDGHGLTEFLVLKDFSSDRIGMIQIKPQRSQNAAAPIYPHIGPVPTSTLILNVQREVVHGGELDGVIDVTSDDLLGDCLQVLI